MELIIKIPDRTYDFIMGLNQHTFGSKYAHKDVQADIVKAVKESTPYKPSGGLTEAEKIICKVYLEDLDKMHTCNEYKLLMSLINNAPTVDERPQCECGGSCYLCDVADCEAKL